MKRPPLIAWIGTSLQVGAQAGLWLGVAYGGVVTVGLMAGAAISGALHVPADTVVIGTITVLVCGLGLGSTFVVSCAILAAGIGATASLVIGWLIWLLGDGIGAGRAIGLGMVAGYAVILGIEFTLGPTPAKESMGSLVNLFWEWPKLIYLLACGWMGWQLYRQAYRGKTPTDDANSTAQQHLA